MSGGASARQKALYEAIHDVYEAHYYDDAAMAYRERFYYQPLFRGLDFNGKSVADLACGSGHNSVMLLQRFPSADVSGFDISKRACSDYRRIVGRPAFESDLTKPMDAVKTFDAAMIFGGLHHCVFDLRTTLENIARLLKPGGVFLMLEPNKRCYLQMLRRLWYALDRRYFDAESEAALDHEHLAADAATAFRPELVRFMGGPGYFLIAQSLVLRVPLSWKRAMLPALLRCESMYNRLPGHSPYAYFLARWRRLTSA